MYSGYVIRIISGVFYHYSTYEVIKEITGCRQAFNKENETVGEEWRLQQVRVFQNRISTDADEFCTAFLNIIWINYLIILKHHYRPLILECIAYCKIKYTLKL